MWAYFIYLFIFQRLLHCSWDMNNAFRLMNSNPHYSCSWITLCRRYYALFMGTTTNLFKKKTSQMGPTVLFKYLKKIISTVFFQFSAKQAVSKWTLIVYKISCRDNGCTIAFLFCFLISSPDGIQGSENGRGLLYL